MSFSDWINDDSVDESADDRTPGAQGFEHAARLRAQAERESNRARRRHTWRARAELARRSIQPRPDGADEDDPPA